MYLMINERLVSHGAVVVFELCTNASHMRRRRIGVVVGVVARTVDRRQLD
jgi:hypothetical protein